MDKQRSGLLSRMMLNYSAIMVVTLVILIIAAYQYILGVSRKNAEINQQQLAEKTITQVENYLSTMDTKARQVCADVKIINLFDNLQSDTGPDNFFEKNILECIDAETALASLNEPDKTVWRICVFNQYGDFISAGANILVQPVVNSVELPSSPLIMMRDLLLPDKNCVITPPRSDRWTNQYGDTQYISLFRPLTDYYATNVFGIVEVQQDMELLESAIALDVLTNIQVFLFDSEGNQVLPVGRSYGDIDTNRYYITRGASKEYGWSVALVQDSQEFTRPYQTLIWYLFGAATLLIAFLLTAVYIISRRIVKPITDLSQKVRIISIGEVPSHLVSNESLDEVRELSSAFTSMLKRLNDSIMVERKAYMLALQSQMDPHFLYNSLAVIGGMGVEYGCDQVVNACDILSNLIAYSTSYDSAGVMMADEIENVDNYLKLMKLRYERYFTYTLHIDDSLLKLPMPRLILQPIVENCFEHGFKNSPPPWDIRIHAALNGSSWRIEIADNGIGITDEDIRELDRKVSKYTQNLSDNYKELKLGGMGLVNTIMRLKFMGDGKMDYTISRAVPTGTIVTLKGVLK